MSTTTNAFASDSCHWYAADGTPAYEQPCKSKPGEMRPTTIRDARTLNLVPSVTTIIRCAAQPGLERWKQQSLLHAALTLPRIDGETEDDFAKRALEDAAAQSLAAREKGTMIHGVIEQFFDGVDPSPEMKPYAMAAFHAVTDVLPAAEWKAEKSFACADGYGGKVDLHGTSPEFVCDFKTKSNWTDADVKRGLAYDEHGMQLCAYAAGLGLKQPILFNVFISTDEPGKYHVHQWPAEDHERLLRMFWCLLHYWREANRFAMGMIEPPPPRSPNRSN